MWEKEGFCSVCNGLIYMFHYVLTFLVTFAKLQNVTVSSAMLLSPSVRPSGAPLLSLDGFSWNLTFEDYSNIEKIRVSLGLARMKDTLHDYLRTLLTYSMVHSPSWAANWFAASQEIPRISRNPKVHYRTHKRPPPVSILGQPNPVHIPTSYLLEIHPNIIHPSTPRSPQWSLSLRFPTKTLYTPSLLTHTRHMPSPSHSSRFYHSHNIEWGVQII